MSSPKKSSPKTKSPAPATKTAASKTAAPRKSAGAATTVASAAPSPVAAVPPPRIVPAPKPAPAPVQPLPVKSVPATRRMTSITARVDVGYGNALYIRGEGPGLSWEKGRLMECVWSDSWMVMLEDSARPCVFKFLINDATWSTGPDYTAEAGSSVTLTPQF